MSSERKSGVFDPSSVVDTQAIESVIERKELGTKLRMLRLKRSMGLLELGERSGLSASFLSQIETGRVVPTLRNRARIAAVHKVDIASFFTVPQRPTFRISRQKERISISRGPKARPFMWAQSMSALIPDRRLVPCIAELHAGLQNEAFNPHAIDGLEFSFVLQGSVSIKTYLHFEVLEKGDLVWLDGSIERQYRCVGQIPAQVMIISFPFRQ